ncbi:MAG: M15 family metallopeptidase [Ilumatobacteraceae bacterium]
MARFFEQVRPLTRPSILTGEINGKLSPSILAPIPAERNHDVRGFVLVIPAARAYTAMHAAAREDGVILKPVSSADTYRTLQQQLDLFLSRYVVNGPCGGCKTCDGFGTRCKMCLPNGKPVATAACPGTSNHGLGLAVDVGTETTTATETERIDARTLQWLEDHAITFGFGWETVPSEPWHIRYNAGDAIPRAVLDFESRGHSPTGPTGPTGSTGSGPPAGSTTTASTRPATTEPPPPEPGDDMPTHRWAPKGFLNEFEIPGCLPVTPADILASGESGALLNEANPFEHLPLIKEFHIHRLTAVIHRNGITAQQITDHYFIRDPTVELAAHERQAYEKLGIRFDT